ncbi:S-layer homology domain-containing protein [uncultured Oscillibacter sp.]|uniref:S-layer homology domain-containing protein n=1 Tax=uncultured Oscillibacter sp. TaxID=876091 RepID=UPI0025F93064|nr:S-layer homology domain-containing protein [uncultured Oscillibacter sp.]
MKKKLLSLALVLVMALTLLPTAAFAAEDLPEPPGTEESAPGDALTNPPEIKEADPDASSDSTTTPSAGTCTGQAGCTAATHNKDCVEACTGGPDCPNTQGTAAVHKSNCPKADPACTGKADCTATTHNTDCVSQCTGTDACQNTQGKNDVHKAGCPKATSTPVTPPPACTGKADCTATTHNQDCVSQCTGTDACLNTQGNVDAHKTGCPKASTTQPPNPNGHSLTLVEAKAATCTAAGNEAYYKCSKCPKYFADANATTEITLADTVISATGHTKPSAQADYERTSDTQHSYTCPACNTKVAEAHTFSSNVCTACGFERTVTPSPYRYIDISSAYVNRYSISLTWASDLPGGTLFDIYVDGGLYASAVAPSKSSSGYFSYTADFSHYLNDSYYTVAVYLYSDHSVYDSTRVYNRYYDDDYWYPDYYPNGTPGTNSSGIPYASQVTGRYSASEAIRILRNSNHGTLQHDLLNSTYASNSFSDLEAAVKRVNNVSVQVNIDRSDVPSAIRNIRIDGAAFNASRTNSTVRLEVDAPSVNRYPGYGYQFSMSLTGVGNDSSLDVPVKITMPVPSDINANSVRVLHYHNSGAPTVIDPKVSGSSMSFTVTGFSDFVVTDNRANPYYYYYTPGGVPVSARRSIMEEHLSVILPILASMPPSGYVFDDVAPGHWAAAEIAWARDGGMMSGYYDGTFRPYAATTRQELWMVLARLAGARPADMWAAREWAMNAGISDGRNPHSPLSVQQMISMLYRYAQYLGVDVSGQANLRTYRDNSMISGYARNAMAWAVDRGIVAGDANNRLNPQNIATRADFAVFLYRFVY